LAPSPIDSSANQPPNGERPVPEGVRFFILSAELTAAVKVLSEQEHVELFVTLLSVFNVLLARYSRQEEIVVATAVGGIPEQVKGLEVAEEQSQTAQLNGYGTN